ncbi:hypothetical protein Hanom_Chr14g01297011 [Helianthus anomalus]
MHPSRCHLQVSAVPSYIITCENYGHGTDLRGCPQSPLVPEGRYILDIEVIICINFNFILTRGIGL